METKGQRPAVDRLAGEDLSFYWLDSPLQPTTMAMLMVLDRPPDPARLCQAFERAVAAVPRLAQRVVDAPLGLTLPHWEDDPTFDLDYHVRRHSLGANADMDELWRAIAPMYETPFDRSRPLWEARIYHGLNGGQAAQFFKLHHAVADGIGGNAIFAALTDAVREPAADGTAPRRRCKGTWAPTSLGDQLRAALRDRVELDLQRAGTLAETVIDAVQHPDKIARAAKALRSLVEVMRFDSHSPLKARAGRARRLSGLALPFADVRALKQALGGSMIDVILTIMARAMGAWHAKHGLRRVRELMTLVPVNLRKPEEWAEKAHIGNVATGILVPLPIRTPNVLAAYREIHRRMEAKKADPASTMSPLLADVLSIFPRTLLSWMAEATVGGVDFIVTNVPGILVPRYLAGAEILSAYPFAPVAMKSPASIALYGYRDQLFVGVTSDEAVMPDVAAFEGMIGAAFAELRAAVLRKPPRRAAGVRRGAATVETGRSPGLTRPARA